jgi:hypothetical protein
MYLQGFAKRIIVFWTRQKLQICGCKKGKISFLIPTFRRITKLQKFGVWFTDDNIFRRNLIRTY